ncbi:MAG TPA: hypothetical protein VIK54_14960 [Acidimicrobiia bacterium]
MDTAILLRDPVAIETGDSDTIAASRLLLHAIDFRDVLVVTALAVATVLAHPARQILSMPYWTDEAWVATLTRIPFSQLREFSSSTPIGWLVLARLVPGSGLQRGRLLTLAFSVGAVVAAYVFARTLQWGSRPRARFAGAVAGLVIMLAPVSLLRNDLKQYTSDACCALIVLSTTARTERRGDRRSLIWMGAVALATLPFSTTSAFVAVAAFCSLFVAAVIARMRARIVDVVAVGAVIAVTSALFFAVFVLPSDTPLLRRYWNLSYLRGSPGEVLQTTWTRFGALAPKLGMPALVAVALFVVGIVVLVRRGQSAVGLAVALLWIEAFVLGVARRYPFLDQRTSHYLLVSSLAVIAVGAVGLVAAVANKNEFAGAVLAVAMLSVFAYRVQPYVKTINIHSEDVRDPVAYVAAHRSANDVIVVNGSGAWGFSYYWPQGPVRLHKVTPDVVVAEAPAAHAIYATGRTDEAVLDALHSGLEQQRQSGPGSRLFIVRTHLTPGERAAWNKAFAALDVTPHTVASGPEPLLEIDTP